MVNTWMLHISTNVEVAIDDSVTDGLETPERVRLVSALVDGGASSVMHYGTIIATYEDSTIEDAEYAMKNTLDKFFAEGDI